MLAENVVYSVTEVSGYAKTFYNLVPLSSNLTRLAQTEALLVFELPV